MDDKTPDVNDMAQSLVRSIGREAALNIVAILRKGPGSPEWEEMDYKLTRTPEEIEAACATEEEIQQAEHEEERRQQEEFAALLARYTQNPDQLSPDPPKWLLHELIGESVLTQIHGTQGDGKSMLALWIAKAIAEGSDLLGRKGTCKPTPVVYVDHENPESEVRKRLAAIGALNHPHIRYWGEWRKDRPPLAFDNKILQQMADLGRPFFIFDSLSSFEEDCDENMPAEMQRIMNKVHLLAFHSAGALVLHHDNKADGFRGATSIAAVPEMVIHLSQNKKSRVITLSEDKFRLCAGWTLRLKMPFEPTASCDVISDVRGATPDEVEKKPVSDRTIRLLKLKTARKMAAMFNLDPTQRQYEEATGIPQKTISRLLNEPESESDSEIESAG